MSNVSNKYAQALFEVALSHEILDTIHDELKTIAEVITDKHQNLTEIDKNPKISAEQRKRMVGIAFGDANIYLRNMLMMTADNRHLSIVPEIYQAFKNYFNTYYQQSDATVESVEPLTDETIEAIKQVMKKRTGLREIYFKNVINKELIGGIKVKIGTKVYDDSIQKDLNNLERLFNN